MYAATSLNPCGRYTPENSSIKPMVTPPTSAPGMEPKPPRTAAANAFSPMNPMIDVDQRHRREQHAGDGGHPRRDRPDQREHSLHRDAHVVGGELVLRGGLHGDAHARVREEGVEQRAQEHRADDDRATYSWLTLTRRAASSCALNGVGSV